MLTLSSIDAAIQGVVDAGGAKINPVDGAYTLYINPPTYSLLQRAYVEQRYPWMTPRVQERAPTVAKWLLAAKTSETLAC